VEGDVAGRNLDLEKIRLVVDEPELRVAPGPYESPCAHLELEIAAIARVELITWGQRGIDLRGSPVLGARPEVRDVAFGVAEPRRSGSDCVVVPLRRPHPRPPAPHLPHPRHPS